MLQDQRHSGPPCLSPRPIRPVIGDAYMTDAPNALGNSTLQVGRIGLGCMGMSEFYGGPRDEAGHIKTLQAAIDLGIKLFDTADMYGVGHNEELLSKAFSDRWDKVTVATKFGVRRGAKGEWLGVCGRPEYVKAACDKSLKRLGCETIDLYYQHRPDPDVPVEESVGAMKELVEQGKVRFIGLSEFSAEQIRAAHAVHPITALQTEYSLWTRDVEAEGILAACRDLGIAFVAYAPLGRGFLTGAIPNRQALDANDWRRDNPRFQRRSDGGKRPLRGVDPRHRRPEGRNASTGGACLGAGAGRRHLRDPWHAAHRATEGKPGSLEGAVQRRGTGTNPRPPAATNGWFALLRVSIVFSC